MYLHLSHAIFHLSLSAYALYLYLAIYLSNCLAPLTPFVGAQVLDAKRENLQQLQLALNSRLN